MSSHRPDPHVTVVGNPGSRRVGLFRAAARALAVPTSVWPWADVLTGRVPALAPGWLRIDSPGEDPRVDGLLRGAEPTPDGELGCGPDWYAGLRRGLDLVDAATRATPGLVPLHDPAELLTMFDKAATHAALTAAEVPVPEAVAVVPVDGREGWAAMQSAVLGRGWDRVFLKPRHGSSAAGVIALSLHPRGRVVARTSLRREGGRLVNVLRVGELRAEREVAALVDALADELAPSGLHVERWFPKLTHDGRTVDFRVLVVAGRATHVVARTSAGPITNLHLGATGGNRRGDLATIGAAVGAEALAQVRATAEQAARCFPGTHCVGVDVLLSSRARRTAVAEVNAFGDLLPGLAGLHPPHRDPWAEQLADLVRGRSAA